MIKLVVDMARNYDCPELLRTNLSAYLHAYRQELFIEIAKDPPRFAMLAAWLEDRSVMKKALIHLIGCWPSWNWRTSKARLTATPRCSNIIDLVKRKAEELTRKCQSINEQLLENTLEDGDGPITIENPRESWLVISFFRDWLN